MLFTSNNCIIYSKDADLIGKLIMHWHKVHYDSDIKRTIQKVEELHPNLVIFDLFKHLEAQEIDAIIQIHSHVIIRWTLPEDIIKKIDAKNVIIIPPNTTNEDIINRIAHINETVNGSEKNKRKVLIIEDNTDILEMYAVAFQSKWYDVDEALDGLIGITKAATFHPDIIILDIMMPHMDGFEVLYTLRNNTTLSATIIVNSNLEWINEEQKVKQLWADYFLRKSEYTPLDVIAFIEKNIVSK